MRKVLLKMSFLNKNCNKTNNPSQNINQPQIKHATKLIFNNFC